MPVDRDELSEAITKVLLKAKLGDNGVTVSFMTSYQILQKLPKWIREELENDYGRKVGKNTGNHFSSATYVAQTTKAIPGVEVAWLDTRYLHFMQKTGKDVRAGYGLVGLFRLPEKHRLRK